MRKVQINITGWFVEPGLCKRAIMGCFLLAGMLFIHNSAIAQIEKGMYVAGGSADLSLSYNWKNSNFNLAFSPSFGVFVVRGFAIGGRYAFAVGSAKTYNASKQEYTTTTTFNTQIGPLLRYYYGKKPLKGVAAFSANYLVNTQLRSTTVTNAEGFSLQGSLGAAYFFNPHISLETAMYINASGYKGVLPTTRIGFSVGLFAFLDKKKQE